MGPAQSCGQFFLWIARNNMEGCIRHRICGMGLSRGRCGELWYHFGGESQRSRAWTLFYRTRVIVGSEPYLTVMQQVLIEMETADTGQSRIPLLARARSMCLEKNMPSPPKCTFAPQTLALLWSWEPSSCIPYPFTPLKTEYVNLFPSLHP